MTVYEIILLIVVIVLICAIIMLFDEKDHLERRVSKIESDTYDSPCLFVEPNKYHQRINKLEKRIDNIPQVKAEMKLEKLKEIEQQIIDLQEEE
jgi:hypothetical protein